MDIVVLGFINVIFIFAIIRLMVGYLKKADKLLKRGDDINKRNTSTTLLLLTKANSAKREFEKLKINTDASAQLVDEKNTAVDKTNRVRLENTMLRRKVNKLTHTLESKDALKKKSGRPKKL